MVIRVSGQGQGRQSISMVPRQRKKGIDDGKGKRQYEQDIPAPRRCRDDGGGGEVGSRRIPIRQWATAVDYRRSVEEKRTKKEMTMTIDPDHNPYHLG